MGFQVSGGEVKRREPKKPSAAGSCLTTDLRPTVLTATCKAAENLDKLLGAVPATWATPALAASTSGAVRPGNARQFDYRDPGLIIQAMMGSGSFFVSSFSFWITSGWSCGVIHRISLMLGRILAMPYRPPR